MTAPNMTRIDGIRLSLRVVMPDDADYIRGLRVDPRYNAHLSEVTGTVNDQRSWIENYKLREDLGQEYYYVIERRNDRVPCGLVRLYNITKDHFVWGSWILDENKPSKAALESAVLSFGLAFDNLALAIGHIDVRKQNSHAISFYRRFGMQETHQDEINIYFKYSKEQYKRQRPAYEAILNQQVRI